MNVVHHVAKLAGLPKAVTERAQQILHELETGHPAVAVETKPQLPATPKADAGQADLAMGSLFASTLSDQLLTLDVMAMTPLEAINELYRLQQQAKGEAGRR